MGDKDDVDLEKLKAAALASLKEKKTVKAPDPDLEILRAAALKAAATKKQPIASAACDTNGALQLLVSDDEDLSDTSNTAPTLEENYSRRQSESTGNSAEGEDADSVNFVPDILQESHGPSSQDSAVSDLEEFDDDDLLPEDTPAKLVTSPVRRQHSVTPPRIRQRSPVNRQKSPVCLTRSPVNKQCSPLRRKITKTSNIKPTKQKISSSEQSRKRRQSLDKSGENGQSLKEQSPKKLKSVTKEREPTSKDNGSASSVLLVKENTNRLKGRRDKYSEGGDVVAAVQKLAHGNQIKKKAIASRLGTKRSPSPRKTTAEDDIKSIKEVVVVDTKSPVKLSLKERLGGYASKPGPVQQANRSAARRRRVSLSDSSSSQDFITEPVGKQTTPSVSLEFKGYSEPTTVRRETDRDLPRWSHALHRDATKPYNERRNRRVEDKTKERRQEERRHATQPRRSPTHSPTEMKTSRRNGRDTQREDKPQNTAEAALDAKIREIKERNAKREARQKEIEREKKLFGGR